MQMWSLYKSEGRLEALKPKPFLEAVRQISLEVGNVQQACLSM